MLKRSFASIRANVKSCGGSPLSTVREELDLSRKRGRRVFPIQRRSDVDRTETARAEARGPGHADARESAGSTTERDLGAGLIVLPVTPPPCQVAQARRR